MAMHASKNKKGLPVTLWSRSAELAESIRATGSNQQYLQGIQLPTELLVSSDLNQLFKDSLEEDLLFIATPVSGLKETVNQLLKLQQVPKNWVWLCKGLEPKTSLMPHQVIARELSLASANDRGIQTAVLSGPSALTVASDSNELIAKVQDALHHGNMRIYGSNDIVGVELGGAIKNVLAIATGIGDGLGLGLNARAALLTRGLAEMMRLMTAIGGKSETAMGLTGVGDLILTATGDLSRNRRVGLQLAAGKKLPEILKDLGHVAEGVLCAQALSDLAKSKGIEMPITHMVCEVLFKEMDVATAVKLLMGRDAKSEA
jgi:glycerol-3-phosphate dehydrogenase (NAD(P)+)